MQTIFCGEGNRTLLELLKEIVGNEVAIKLSPATELAWFRKSLQALNLQQARDNDAFRYLSGLGFDCRSGMNAFFGLLRIPGLEGQRDRTSNGIILLQPHERVSGMITHGIPASDKDFNAILGNIRFRQVSAEKGRRGVLA